MNTYVEQKQCCNIHARKVAAVGICGLCLKERLVDLVSKQEFHLSPTREDADQRPLNLLKFQNGRYDAGDKQQIIISPETRFVDTDQDSFTIHDDDDDDDEDSFITIEFDGGSSRGTWVHSRSSKREAETFVKAYNQEMKKEMKGVVELAKAQTRRVDVQNWPFFTTPMEEALQGKGRVRGEPCKNTLTPPTLP